MATERDSAGAETLLAGELPASKLLQLLRLVRRRVAQLIRHHEEDVRPAIAVLRAHDFPFAHVAHGGALPRLGLGGNRIPPCRSCASARSATPGRPALSLCPTVVVGAPVVLYFALGDSSRGTLESLKTWMARNNAVIMTVLRLVGREADRRCARRAELTGASMGATRPKRACSRPWDEAFLLAGMNLTARQFVSFGRPDGCPACGGMASFAEDEPETRAEDVRHCRRHATSTFATTSPASQATPSWTSARCSSW